MTSNQSSQSIWLPPVVTRLAHKLFGTSPLIPPKVDAPLIAEGTTQRPETELLAQWLLQQWQIGPQSLPSRLIQGLKQWVPTAGNVLLYGQLQGGNSFDCLARSGTFYQPVPYGFISRDALMTWAQTAGLKVFDEGSIIWLMGSASSLPPVASLWASQTAILLGHLQIIRHQQALTQSQSTGLVLRQMLLENCYGRHALISHCLSWLAQEIHPGAIHFWQRSSLSQSQFELFPLQWQAGSGLMQQWEPSEQSDTAETALTQGVPDDMGWVLSAAGEEAVFYFPLTVGGQIEPFGWFALTFGNLCFDLPTAQQVMLKEVQPLMARALMNAWQYDQALLLANLDELTGLVNRRGFYQRFELELDRIARHGRPLCLALVDVDHFKLLNDTYGHLVGDQVLQQLTAIMAANIRKTDLLARFGGEEFALLLPEMSEVYAFELLDRLRAAVAQTTFRVSDTRQTFELKVTISAGFTLANEDKLKGKSKDWTTIIATLLAEADTYLYEAKSQGRDQIVCHPLPDLQEPMAL